MTASILPFRRRTNRASSHTPFPAYMPPPPLYLNEPVVWNTEQIELAMRRDQLVSYFLELRDVHLPRMDQRDRAIVQGLNHFMLYGGLSECRESLEHNLGVAERLLARYRQPPSTFQRIGHFIHQWLWEVTQP